MIRISRPFVRILIRRPHAYAFMKKYSISEVPSIVVLDGEGGVRGRLGLIGAETQALVDLMKKTSFAAFLEAAKKTPR